MSETKLSFSEAILLGSMLKPQGFGILRNVHETACANDAALLAIGKLHSFGNDPVDEWKIAGAKSQCPVQSDCLCSETFYHTVARVAAHLNDHHKWSRERIATEFIAPLERMAEVAERAIVISPMEIVQLMEAK